MPAPTAAPLATAEEVAAHLGVSPSTVRAWARTGKIPAVKIAPTVLRFDLADVTEWIARHRNAPAEP